MSKRDGKKLGTDEKISMGNSMSVTNIIIHCSNSRFNNLILSFRVCADPFTGSKWDANSKSLDVAFLSQIKP